jgi:hypothetical protein
MRAPGLLVLTAAAVVTVVPAALGAAAPRLFGTVGPGESIVLEDGGGALVTKVDPGTYEIVVRDLSDEHNFHLSGPGVNEATEVETQGTVTWTVTLQNGTYTLLCDPHFTSMRRTFAVGTPPAAPPKPAAPPRLLATVGPSSTISLRSASGAALTTLTAGTYAVAVRDRSKLHNFHLVGKGVNRKSSLAGTAIQTWQVTLAKGTLRFFSDRSPQKVKGSVLVS